ncbi:MAG: cellulase family glycosylhydrolase [Pirellulales bacterium]
MRRTTVILLSALFALAATVCAAAPPEDNSRENRFGDFSWMHGANYTPSYAATDVETWLNYDPAVIDRELGYAERIGLNCVRVFLQSLVYEHAPEKFLDHFADFVDRADRHELKVMPILFDSCFGVSPSLESQHMWVANPGPDRMNEAHFEALDAYTRTVVTRYVGDERIALWDVMNEPTVTVLSLTDAGKAQVWAFVRHYARLVHESDPTHAITVGIAGTGNSEIVDLVDVLSCHSYAATRETLREALTATQTQARQAGKPWIISECCAPGWGSRYEMVMPELREFNVGHTVWEVVIGKNQFAPVSGLFYPDGSVRRISSIEAVAGRAIPGLTLKPDAEGVPIARARTGRLAEHVRFMTRNEVTDSTWRERNTAVAALIVHGVYKPDAADVLKKLQDARTAYTEGRRGIAYGAVAELLSRAAELLTERARAGLREKHDAGGTREDGCFGV